MFQITDSHYAAAWLLDSRAPKVEMPVELKERLARMRKEAERVIRRVCSLRSPRPIRRWKREGSRKAKSFLDNGKSVLMLLIAVRSPRSACNARIPVQINRTTSGIVMTDSRVVSTIVRASSSAASPCSLEHISGRFPQGTASKRADAPRRRGCVTNSFNKNTKQTGSRIIRRTTKR